MILQFRLRTGRESGDRLWFEASTRLGTAFAGEHLVSGSPNAAKTRLVPRLTRWGVSPLADLVYRLLVCGRSLSQSQIGQALDLSVKQVAVALDELEAVGTVSAQARRLSRAKDVCWRALPPAAAIERLKERQSALARQLTRTTQRLAALTDLGLDLYDSRAFPLGTVQPVHGLTQAQRRLAELAAMTRHETLSMYPDHAISSRVVKRAAAADRHPLERGVSTLMLSVPSNSADESGAHGIHLRTLGARMRQLPSVPMRLIVMDRATAIIRINPTNAADGILEITARAVVEQLTSYFLLSWGRAKPTAREWNPPMSLSAREKAIVALLAAGHTDSTVAKTLDLSVRTIAYTVSNLMERYEVKTRFQLGLVLGAEAAVEPESQYENSEGG